MWSFTYLAYRFSVCFSSYCNQCRDFDLCRDPDLTQHNWHCTNCQQPYNKSSIELSLIDIISKRHVAYQVQDVQCLTCGKIKVTNMTRYCACSGNYANVMKREDFIKHLRTFHNIAKFHQLKWLEEVVNWCLEVSN